MQSQDEIRQLGPLNNTDFLYKFQILCQSGMTETKWREWQIRCPNVAPERSVEMARITLTDRFIKSRKPAPAGQRVDYADGVVPGLALRVTDRGHRSFVLVARYPSNPKNPTRRALGDYGALSLEDARSKARAWLEMIGKGIDPRIEEARRVAAERSRSLNAFEVVAGEFLGRCAKGWAKHADAKKTLEEEFGKRWRGRPAADIQPIEVADAIRAIVKRGSPYQAHNALGYLRRMYNWAIGTNEFGLTASPVASLKPKDLIGEREARTRILTPAELRTVWQASGGNYVALQEGKKRLRATANATELGYPYGPLIRLLILTGQRELEVGEARWSEFDLENYMWTIPASRMKGDRTHEVPLAPEAVALLKSLPRFAGGDYLFSTDGGVKPVNGFSKAKARLDKLSGVTGWKLHDLRRTMRTHLSALPVEDLVRELVIAHAKPGLHRVYDQHGYQDEKRRCLELWEQRLSGLLSPKPPAGVTNLAEARTEREAAAQ